MAFIDWNLATFIASALAAISLGLIILYLLFYNEEEEEFEEGL